MRAFISGLAIGIAGAALAPLVPPAIGAGTPTHAIVATASDPHPGTESRDADPYAPLWHCREEVRSFLSVRSESHARRLKALEDCVAAAEHAQVAVADP
jgi:hypothetical protein